jgi:hypothetical protein
MLTKHYRQQLQKCLREQGIFGQPAARLLEELDDHFYAALDSLRRDGHDKQVAQRLAWEILGRPETIAASAAEVALQAYWAARRPLLFAAAVFVLFFVMMVLLYTAATLGIWLAVSELHVAHIATHTTAKILNFCITWGPQLLSTGALGLLALRYPLGWRSLLSGSAAVGLATAILTFHIHPASHGPGSGGVDLSFGPFINMIAGWIGLGHGHAIDLAVMRNLFHLLFPISLCLAAKSCLNRLDQLTLV